MQSDNATESYAHHARLARARSPRWRGREPEPEHEEQRLCRETWARVTIDQFRRYGHSGSMNIIANQIDTCLPSLMFASGTKAFGSARRSVRCSTILAAGGSAKPEGRMTAGALADVSCLG